MPSIWIDVEDASGTKYGQPITTATNWQSTRRMDAAGTFAFTMPASDPRAALLAHKRIVRCWEMGADGVIERGCGIIDHVEKAIGDGKGPTMLVVSGDDLLRELVYRTVGELNLYDDTLHSATHLSVSYASGDPSTPVTLPADIDLDPGPANFFNIGYSQTFSKIDFTITVANATQGSVIIQYYNGDGWQTVGGVVNTTILSGKPFARSGYISFDTPSGWTKLSGYYPVRIHCNDTNPGQFRVSAINIHELMPTSDALQTVMALAPPGWSLDAAGAFATESAVYLPGSRGSVLATLGRVAAQTGEHWRLAPSGRRVHWLGSALQSSGLRAIAASESSPATLIITKLQAASDSYEMINRLYLYGGGAGNGRLTLATTTRTPPAGYNVSQSGSYIENTPSQEAYGRIDSEITFPDITPADISSSALVKAANTLFDRGYYELRRKSQLQYAYDLSVIPSLYRIYPGQTIRVIYDEWIDGYHAIAINEELVVLETIEQFSEQGHHTVGLKVATVDYWPQNDHRTVARALGDIETDRSLRLPQTGLESTDSGIPTFLAISAGMVVGVAKVVPVGDGIYWPIDRLIIESGVITAVNP